VGKGVLRGPDEGNEGKGCGGGGGKGLVHYKTLIKNCPGGRPGPMGKRLYLVKKNGGFSKKMVWLTGTRRRDGLGGGA